MLDWLRWFLVDLPVDLVVVLEQQEGAQQHKRTGRALQDLGCPPSGEHVFVNVGASSDG